jgi:hypothetical protein
LLTSIAVTVAHAVPGSLLPSISTAGQELRDALASQQWVREVTARVGCRRDDGGSDGIRRPQR